MSYRLQEKRQRHKEEQINPTMGEQQEKQLVQIFILTKLWLATKHTLPTQKYFGLEGSINIPYYFISLIANTTSCPNPRTLTSEFKCDVVLII